jgi:hypothetical protein
MNNLPFAAANPPPHVKPNPSDKPGECPLCSTKLTPQLLSESTYVVECPSPHCSWLQVI